MLLQAPEAVHDVALVEDQVKVLVWLTATGLADSAIWTTGSGPLAGAAGGAEAAGAAADVPPPPPQPASANAAASAITLAKEKIPRRAGVEWVVIMAVGPQRLVEVGRLEARR